MKFLDWLLALQREVQTPRRRYEPIGRIEHEYENIVAEQRMEESVNCSRCYHAGVFHKGRVCELCNKPCEFQIDSRTKTTASTRSGHHTLVRNESPLGNPTKSDLHSSYGFSSRKPREPIPTVLDMLIDAEDGKLPLEKQTNPNPTIVDSEPSKPYVHMWMSEKEFQDQVILLAEINGWRVAHTFSRKVRGWPDLVLVRPPRFVCLELKAQRGQPSTEQSDWINDLDNCEGTVGRVVRPSDWKWLKQLLRHQEETDDRGRHTSAGA